MSYTAPTRDILFVLEEVADIGELAGFPAFSEVTPELIGAILDEAGKFTAGVLAPLNRVADEQGSRLENGIVRTADGLAEAYAQFVAGGWNGMSFSADFGGQGLPWTLTAAVQEMVTSACMSFSLCPLLTQGAVELLSAHGNEMQKRTYLPHLVSGRWTGTMNLTEPQAGSDVGALRTRAVRDGDRYRISGQKIFITFGDHEMAENIIHMVLARTPTAPSGTKGVSLFIVPKYLVRPDGGLAGRNDLRCVALERKLGIRGAPTATMSYGDNEGAIGELVGEENRGIEYMFTMMNNARLSVGIEGLAIAERAYQQARDYAGTRIQGRAADGSDPAPVPIIRHPDVRRMLLTMRSQIAAMRALVLFTAASFDRARHHPDDQERAQHQRIVDLLTPVLKAWCTDTGCTVTSTGIQIHGGLGFIEATGAAQHYRDARIAPIYEGTNGIQAADLVDRKLRRDGGATARRCIEMMRKTAMSLAACDNPTVNTLAPSLDGAINHLLYATDYLAGPAPVAKSVALAAASPYLALFGTVAGGWLLGRLALAAHRRRHDTVGDVGLFRRQSVVASFYFANILPMTAGLASATIHGSDAILEAGEDHF